MQMAPVLYHCTRRRTIAVSQPRNIDPGRVGGETT